MSTQKTTRYLLFAVTFALAAFSLLWLSQETEAAFDFTVEGTAQQWGDPGDQVVYQLKIKNNGASDKDYNFTVVNTPPSGWDAFILPTTISVDRDGGTGFVNLYIDIWEWAYESNSALITVQANEDGGSSKTVSTTTKANQVFGTTIEPVGESSKSVDPEATVQFTLNVQNDDGNGVDTLTLSVDVPTKALDWTFVFPSTISLDRNVSRNVTLDVTPDSEAVAGLAGITFKATSEDDTTISTATITVRVNKLPDMNIAPVGKNSKNVRVDPIFGKTTATYSFSITNVGNAADTYLLSVEDGVWQTMGWTATLDTLEAANVPVGATVTLSDVLVVTVPSNASANDEVTIIVKITSDADNAVTKTFTSRTRVLQDYKPRLAISGDNTKNVEPDKQINFTLSITNNGNGVDDISLNLTGLYKGWGSFTASLFTLDPGDSITTTLKVRPPKNQGAMNGYVISVVATSEDATNKSTRPVYINVDQIYDVSISVVGLALKNADPDEQITYQVEIYNKGNGEDSFQLTRSGDKPAWASIRDSVTLEARQKVTEEVTVKPDNDAIFGDYDIIITATSEDDPGLPPVDSATTLTVRVNQDYDVDALIDVNQKSADPGSTITYIIRVVNQGTGIDTFEFQVTEQPPGWTTNFDSGQLEVDAGQEGSVNLSVTVDDDADNLDFYVNLTVVSKGAEEKGKNTTDTAWTRTKVNQHYEFRLSSSITYKKLDPESSVSIDIIMENKGTGDDTVELSVAKPANTTGWVADLAPSIVVAEHQTAQTTLSITVPDEEIKDTYIIEVTGYSREFPSETHTIDISIEVSQLYDVGLVISQDQKSVDPGKNVTYLFIVQNKGTGTDRIEITINQEDLPDGWQAFATPREVTIGADASEEVNVTVKTDKDADNLDFSINVTATSTEDENATATKETITSINQRYELSLVSELTYKKADPEESITVEITIENKGTGDDTVDLVVTPPVNTTGWITDLAPSVDVNEDDISVTILTITVSEDAVKQSYLISITGTSHDDPTSVASAEITIDVTQRFEVQMLPRTETKSADPGENITFDITIKNKGTGTDTFDLVLGGEVGVDWGSLNQVSVQLEAGDSTVISLTVDVDEDAEPKPNYEIIINITSVEDDAVSKANDTVYRYVDVQSSVGLSVSHVSEYVTIVPDDTQSKIATFAFTVKNDGTLADDFNLELLSSQYNKWISQALPASVNVQPGETSNSVEFSFTIPGYDNDDDVIPADIIFTVTITSDEDETVTDTLDFTLTIDEVLDVTITSDTTTVSVEPGKVAAFDVKVKNEGNERDTIALSIPSDTREWATFEASGTDTYMVTINATEEQTVRVLVSLPEYSNATGTDKTTLEGSQYPISVKALTSDGLATDTQSLTTQILDIYGAGLVISGDDNVITYPSTEALAGDRQEKFTMKLKNQGNRGDEIHLSVLATSYPNEWDVGIYTNTACSVGYTDTSSTSAGSTRTLYVCAIPDQESDPGNVTLIIEASANDGKEDAVTTTATLDVREPARRFILHTDEDELTLAPEDNDAIASTGKFKIVITNTGTHDDKFIAQLDSSLSNDWESPTGTKDDYFFTSNSGSSANRWNVNGQTVEKEGGTDELWFLVVATEEVDTDNYTLRITVKDADEKGTPQTIVLKINIEAPHRSLDLTILDNEEEITPEYKGSDSVNRVKFKVKLVNTGTHMDKYIPEVESNLENEDWEVEFYEDSGHSQKWPTSGVNIDKQETDDLWVFVLVDDEAEEDLYSITISVRDEEDEPDARKEVELISNVTRPDLIVKNINIALEINGAEAEPDTLKDGDSLKILVNIDNGGQADADDTLVEVYLYPKISPDSADFDTITELENAGFVFDNSKKNYLYFLESTTSNFRAGLTKQIVTDDWIVEGGEWYVEIRVDFNEDDDKGEIIEILETNNDARFPELLQIRPDLSITSMRVDNKYVTKAPNVDDVVTFTVTVKNNGAADVDGARLYIWNDNAPPDDMLEERTSRKDYLEFDVAALDEKTVRFKWEAESGEWTGFRAEVNPKCSDISESNNPDCDDLTGRFIDELDRYNNNEFPAGGGEFRQDVGGANVTVEFLIWPDFIIKEIDLDPSKPEIDGDDVVIKVTIENIGAADWATSMGSLKLLVDDGEDYEEEMSITKAIDSGDEEEFELKKKWITPDVKIVELTFELDYTGDEIDETNNKYEDPDSGKDFIELKLEPKGGGIAGTGELDPIVFVLIGLVVVLALMIPIMFKAGKKKGSAGDGIPPGPPDVKTGAIAGGVAAGGVAAAAGAAPTKMSVMIQSPDGKVAKPKMPPSMPVSKLLEICIQKFELADKGEFELKAGEEILAPEKTLTDAGVKEGDKILVIAKDGADPSGATPDAPVAPVAPAGPPVAPPEAK